MLNCFNSTRFKIRIAHVIYLILHALRFKTHRIICRNGISYEVDLSEGIDLSLFLFGYFQKHVCESNFFQLPPNAVIADIGANIGSISLFLAYKYPQAVVYAFEPTNYAYTKLVRNIQLNPNLQNRIHPIQTFIAASETNSDQLKAFSSWRVDTFDGPRHPVHLGISKEATIKQTTLDAFIDNNNISSLDFIKIDTDGYELQVLKSAVNTLNRFKPIIVFELSTYLLNENKQRLADFEDILSPLGYRLIDAKSGHKISVLNLNRIVPKCGSTDVIAQPLTLKHY